MTGDRSARRAGTRVLLLGMMGAGKTSVEIGRAHV